MELKRGKHGVVKVEVRSEAGNGYSIPDNVIIASLWVAEDNGDGNQVVVLLNENEVSDLITMLEGVREGYEL